MGSISPASVVPTEGKKIPQEAGAPAGFAVNKMVCSVPGAYSARGEKFMFKMYSSIKSGLAASSTCLVWPGSASQRSR